ncbi:hypothetical protein INT45_010755 [Circinella minor]|uniref:Uncharacterized protein n=1 Tax=Circinella minor TaxID=1195481 RepID=A0A8H7S0E3_9FUNG|nr:hypothetical protein INT45_010755 [Circinella minor]
MEMKSVASELAPSPSNRYCANLGNFEIFTMTTNAPTDASNDSETKRKNLTLEYVLNSKGKNSIPSLQEFVGKETARIIELTDFRKMLLNYGQLCLREFYKKRMLKEQLKRFVFVVLVYLGVSWSIINKREKVSEDYSPPHPSTTTTRHSASKKSAIIMTEKALQEMENSYKKVIESGNVWRLESGRIVEQVMMDHALGLKYEHPVHSMILNPNDSSYADVFTEKELEEIGNFKAVDFDQELPQPLHEYLYTFLDKKTLHDLNNAIISKTFNPLSQPDLYWARKSFEEVIELYNMRFFDEDYIEDDVEYRIWPFIFKCFDLTEIRARSGKRKSQASSDRHNQSRSLSAHQPTARHHVGMQPDMKCTFMNYELGFSEVALKDEGENGTKELYESGMKAPKMLKDFLVSIVRDRPSIIHAAKTGAFIISGMCYALNKISNGTFI